MRSSVECRTTGWRWGTGDSGARVASVPGWAAWVLGATAWLVAIGAPVRGAVVEPVGGRATALPIESRVTHHFATNVGVRLHYASLGRGPLVVLVHGFPDCWLTWREQMPELARDRRVVAVDLRGYYLSDRPAADAAYDMGVLVEDVAAVIRDCGESRAVVVGHDWGGAIAWAFARARPEMTERLVVLNLPHPRGFLRELAHNPEQQRNSAYAREFQRPGAHTNLTAEALSGWVRDPAARARYREVFGNADFGAMLALYRRNYPREPYAEDASPLVKVDCPVLLIHGLKDRALLSTALNGTWDWVGRDLTLVTIPEADHFVQQDAAELVTRSIRAWLDR